MLELRKGQKAPLTLAYEERSWAGGQALSVREVLTAGYFYYIHPNKMHMLQSLFYLTTALHVSSVIITHRHHSYISNHMKTKTDQYDIHKTLKSVPTLPR